MRTQREEEQGQSTQEHGKRRDSRPRLSRGLQTARHGFDQAIRVLCLTLREIFDESAYARFLARKQVESSRDAYAAFLRENHRRVERRPRCC